MWCFWFRVVFSFKLQSYPLPYWRGLFQTFQGQNVLSCCKAAYWSSPKYTSWYVVFIDLNPVWLDSDQRIMLCCQFWEDNFFYSGSKVFAQEPNYGLSYMGAAYLISFFYQISSMSSIQSKLIKLICWYIKQKSSHMCENSIFCSPELSSCIQERQTRDKR